MIARAQRSAQSGFTLIEVMIAVAILTVMMGMAWFTITTTSDAKEHFEAKQERSRALRVATARMVQDLESAYISSNEDTSRQERRTLFVGKHGGEVGDLRFTSLGHRVLWANANESEQTMISYYAEADRKDSRKTNLIRREARRLSNLQWKNEPASVDVLLRDIEKVEFEYFNFKDHDWQDTWDSTKIDAERSRLPGRVRITIEVRAGDGARKGDTVKFTTQARISMSEELKF